MNRRHFLTTAAAATAGLAAAQLPTRAAGASAAAPLLDAKGNRIKLGMDNFAVRAMKWKGRELVDYAASLKLDTLFITDLPSLGSLEVSAAAELGRYAKDHGIQIQLGSWSICPTSKSFKKDWGTAEEHLALGLRLAKACGSDVFRVVLGSREDRKTPGGIEARIADTVKVLKSQRSLAKDSGVIITIENHAGDMTANELIGLMKEAGTDYVRANMDSGNALWTLEDPMDSLEKLGSYAGSTSLRDGTVWETAKGCKVQWTAHGEGSACDLKKYFARYAQLCPGVPVNIETISGFSVEFPYLEPSFWDAFSKKPAGEFARFLAVAKRGKPMESFDGNKPETQKGELERSVRFLREEIGLGTKS
jgi:sugar phosphate isomerase/epimerase